MDRTAVYQYKLEERARREKNIVKRLINLMLSAVLAGSTMFSAVTFVRAEEPVDLNDGLKNYWNFENVEAGAASVPATMGKVWKQS